jgi:hypothetical protein
MDSAPDIASTLHAWLGHFGVPAAASGAVPPAPTFGAFREVSAPADPTTIVPALAALAAEAMARKRTLWIATADDALLPDISNALDLRLRPLCLVLPGAGYAGRIALRATLALLKSRLNRAAEDSEGPAWNAMRNRLQADDVLWRASLAWSARGLDSEEPPPGLAALFPVRIGPWALAERLAAQSDWVMLVQSAQLPAAARRAQPGAFCTLMLGSGPVTGTTTLTLCDEAMRLRAELEVLGQELAEMELELATAQGELAGFGERYHALIAGRLAELDHLQAKLAQIRMRQAPGDPAAAEAAQQARARAERSGQEHARHRQAHETPPAAFKPSGDLKKRFRQLAQKIHPDRAIDEQDRAWRTQLMSEANRAYRAGNMAALEEVFALWLDGRGLEGVTVSKPAIQPDAESLAAQVGAIRSRIAAIAAELDRLYGSRLYELFAAARVATRQGRDLLEEMAERLDGQIAGAQAALAACAAAAG